MPLQNEFGDPIIEQATDIAPTSGNVAVTNTSGPVLAFNSGRKYAVIVNDSDADIYLALGVTAVVNKGILIKAAGGSFEINDQNMFRGVVNGVTASGSKNVTVSEIAG